MGVRVPTIVLVHAGPAAFPTYLGDTLSLLRLVAPGSNLVLLCSEQHMQMHLADLPAGCSFIPIESFPCSEASAEFERRSQLPREFRDGFWFATSSRFFVLADYMRHFEVEDVIHLENDVLLYFDPAEKLDAFRQYADFAVPLDRTRAIAGVVWLSNSKVAESLAQHMLGRSDINDMDSVGHFCMGYSGARPLPTIPKKYAVDHQLDVRRYSEGLDHFGGVFDAAAIGQYIGGVHWLNDPGDSRFFINESSDLDLRKFDLAWNVRKGVRSLSIDWDGVRTDILAIHAHSKDVLGISPFNHGVPQSGEDIITGERFQALADLTISVSPLTQFHGRESIQSKALLEIAQNENGAVFVPDMGFIEECGKARTIFVYSQLLPYFKAYVAPRLANPYQLIIHNSDVGLGFDDLDLLNQPMLLHCWAQHCKISHTKLSPLPMGLANRRLGSDQLHQLCEVSGDVNKTALLYANLNPEDSSHAPAIEAIRKLHKVTYGAEVDYFFDFELLAKHKFCLCPGKDTSDTYTFWLSIYLDVIPIIVRSEWVEAYSELPVLVLDDWAMLGSVDFDREYVKIKTTAYCFDRLSMDYYRHKILGQK